MVTKVFVKKPPCDRFAPVVGKVMESFGVPKPDSSCLLVWRGVRDVEHDHEIEREMDGRGFEDREAAWDSVLEQNDIRGLEIGNRTRSAPNLKRNDHQIGLAVKRGRNRLLLREAQAN